MSGRRGSISDYPEHLNPFYEGNDKFRFWKFGKIKRSGSFGESLRNTLTFKSFRGKKKDKQATPASPELRRNGSTRTETLNRQTLPTTLSPIYSPARGVTRSSIQVPLPRSRFSERVAKSSVDSGDEVPNGHVPVHSIGEQSENPFEEEEKVAELKPKRIRRRKRRAPLPPNMTREEGDSYLGASSTHNLSKWSLTSVETDISTYSEPESLALDVVNQEISEMMNNITKEMEKMTDETNDSTETKETEEKPRTDIPDIIASSAEGNKSDELRKSSDDTCEEPTQHDPVDENSNVVLKDRSSNNDSEAETCDNKVMQDNITTSHKSDCEGDITYDIDIIPECDDYVNSAGEEPKSEVLYNTTYDHPSPPSPEQDINFNERKSIYITASNDQLDKSDSLNNVADSTLSSENTDINENNTTPPVSPRCKTEVNVILNPVSENGNERQSENEVENEKLTPTTPSNSPIPKMRTHKLSKGDLLGSDATASA